MAQSQPLLTSRQIGNTSSEPSKTTLLCLNCSTSVYTVQKPLVKAQSSSRTTLGFDHGPAAVSRSSLGSKDNKAAASDSPLLTSRIQEGDLLRPDPTIGTLTILKGCLQGRESLAKVAALETFSDIFGLKVEQEIAENSTNIEAIEIKRENVASSSNLQRAKSPRRSLVVSNSETPSLSPSPARNRSKRMAYRTEEEEGDDLDTLHLLENLLPPMPMFLLSTNASPATTQSSGNPLSPRRATTALPSTSYFSTQSPSASQKKLISQLEASGLAELRSQREVARTEIYTLLKEKRKHLADLEHRIRYDAQRLLGRRSRSSSKEEGQRLSRFNVELEDEEEEEEEEGGHTSGVSADQGSPLFERKRTLPQYSSEMARGSSQNSITGESFLVAGTNASIGSGSVAMPGRGGTSTATTSNIGSYLSASFAMRGRDLPKTPTSPSFPKSDLPSKEDEDEWYAQKRRLRERYPHADHSELPSAVNSDDETNMDLKKEQEQSDEDEERRGRGRRPARVALGNDMKEVEKQQEVVNNTTKPTTLAQSVLADPDLSRKSSEESVGRDRSVKKGALKASTPVVSDARSKDKASASGEKKVAFAEVPAIKTADPIVPPKEAVDESADAVFEIDEELDGEGTSSSSDISLNPRAVAIGKEKDALQSAQTEDEIIMARQSDLEENDEDIQSDLPRGSIAESLPYVGSFSAMANLFSAGRPRKSDGKGDYEMDEADNQLDPASLRLEDDTVIPDRSSGISSSKMMHTLTPTKSRGIDDLSDTSVFGSRPRTSRRDSSDLGPDALLTGFPQSTKQQSSTIGFRVAVGEAEAQLSGLLAPFAPSHRNLWASSDKSKLRLNGKGAISKYKMKDEEEKEKDEGEMAWQRKQREIPKTQAGDSLAQSVPIGISGSPKGRRSSMANAKTTTTYHDATSGFDLEPKTSLPYREKKYTPSLRKVTRYLTAPSFSGGPRSSLATISDSSEPGGSIHDASEAARRTSSAQCSVPASVTRGFSQALALPLPGASDIPASTQSTPGLASKSAEEDPFSNVRGSRKSVLVNQYIQPPPPSTYELRLEPSDENKPKAIKLNVLQVQEGYLEEGYLEESSHKPVDVKKDLEFMHTLEQLKTNKRTGWFHHRISRPESIADHMYRMALLSMLLPNDKLDIGKCVQLCLVHDIAEALVGDLTPLDGVSREEKLRREKEALLYLVYNLLQGSPAALRLEQLWMEYEDRKTLESKAVKDLDRFELCLQAVEYERRYNIMDLQPFFEGSIGNVTHVSSFHNEGDEDEEDMRKETHGIRLILLTAVDTKVGRAIGKGKTRALGTNSVQVYTRH